MKNSIFRLICWAFIQLIVMDIQPQEYHGITGLIQTPTAESDSSGTFRGGITWVDKDMLPSMIPYGDGKPFSAPCYTIGISMWTWLEISYTGTLLKLHPNNDLSKPLGYYNEDRHINIKLRPLKEGKWWPALAVGCDDVGRFNRKWDNPKYGNNFFQNVYLALSKHFEIKGYELGTHLAYRYYPSNRNIERRGIAGGITVRPAFYRPLRVIIEWDGKGVNAGTDVLLWHHLFLQAALIHGHGFMGGISYHYTIKF